MALVLFLDAVKIQVDELGKRWIMAIMGGAFLTSTDPVVLREILRDNRIHKPVRQILKLEAGMNNLIVLPVVLVLITISTEQVGGLD